MQQMIDKKSVYVVDFDTMPELPITWLTEGEKAYQDALYFASYPHGLSGTLAGNVSADDVWPKPDRRHRDRQSSTEPW